MRDPEALGGLARLLGKPTSSIQYWARRGSIPPWWHQKVLALAKQRGIHLSKDDL